MDKLNKRNIFEMMDYRADAGFSAMAQIEAYWEALRGSRLMPKRSEIDPRGIETALEYTFVLERIAIGMARLRIAGSHLNHLMGMDVRGMPITSFITPNGAQMGDILEEVFHPSACEIRLSTEVGRDKPAMDARMLLLPLKSDLGDVSRVLGCFIARGEMGNQSRRFDIISTKTCPLVLSSADGGASLAGQKPKPCDTVSGFHDPKVDYSGQSKPNQKPYLRLIKNDG